MLYIWVKKKGEKVWNHFKSFHKNDFTNAKKALEKLRDDGHAAIFGEPFDTKG